VKAMSRQWSGSPLDAQRKRRARWRSDDGYAWRARCAPR
jgi:hypothetical protein